MKTIKSLVKRIKKTSGGKILRKSAFSSHNLNKKSPARKRRHQKTQILIEGDKKKVKRLLPYLES